MSNKVEITIEGSKFSFWSSVTLTDSIDSFSTVEFSAPFDTGDRGFVRVFRPYSFRRVSVSVDGAPKFTGTLVKVSPNMSAVSRTISVECYSRAAVLSDCTPEITDPTQFNDINLHDLANILANPFSVSVEAGVDPGPKFTKIRREPDQDIFSFLSDLAKQRNQIISNNSNGDLLFHRAISSGKPVARIEEGLSPLLSVAPSFDEQQFYSTVTGIRPIRPGAKKSVKYTVNVPGMDQIYRPYVCNLSDATDGDIETAVRAKVGQMLAASAVYTVSLATWRDQAGNLWAPNTIVTVKAPSAFIYRDYNFVVKSVTLVKDPDSETAELELMLPGSFNGDNPGGYPWDV